MPEVIDQTDYTIDVEFGAIRMSVDELYELLEELASKYSIEIKANNGKYRFTDIEDIKKHRHLLAGNPKIQIDRGQLSFSKNNAKFWLYRNSRDEVSDQLVDELRLLLQSFKMPLRSFLESRGGLIATIQVACLVVLFTLENDLARIVMVALLMPLFITQMYFELFDKNSIPLSRKENFVDRNKDRIVLFIFSAVTGGVILKILEYVFSVAVGSE